MRFERRINDTPSSYVNIIFVVFKALHFNIQKRPTLFFYQFIKLSSTETFISCIMFIRNLSDIASGQCDGLNLILYLTLLLSSQVARTKLEIQNKFCFHKYSTNQLR